MLERVQRRFTRLFDDLKNLPYFDRLKKLTLWSLEERKNRADLIKLFKMLRGLSSVPLQTYFQLADGRYTRGHSWKLVKAHSTCDSRLYFFSVRVLNRWNSLPHCTVDVKTVNAFKNQLEKIRSKQMDFFMDTSPLNPLAASTGTLLSHFHNGGNASGAATQGERSWLLSHFWNSLPQHVISLLSFCGCLKMHLLRCCFP